MFNWIFNLISGDRTLGGVPRSPLWNNFRKIHIKNECELCGKKGTFLSPLELHHIKIYSLWPEEELNSENVITGCSNCHLRFYHLGNYKRFYLDIKKDIEYWQEKRKNYH